MPIEKVPIVHKFGIISHSQRLELQERLLKQSYIDKYASKKPHYSLKNPLEVSEDFVQRFNATEGLEEQEKIEATAYKMLERVKRRAGLKTAGKGAHVDLPVAWTELSQLAQCKGKIQEDCLDILVTSLDQAALNRDHIPALFFLAETCLYWLRTDVINQPYLRTGELKLLRMGQLVFTRLFYHHMAGQLQRHDEFKSRLFTYLDGFAECQQAYNPYPNALLYIRYINEVGKMIIGASGAQLDPGEVKEGDNINLQAASGNTEEEMFQEAQLNYDAHSTQSGAISSSVHDLSPTLWHALDVWRCTNHLSGGLPDALNALASCGTGLATESWVDGMCALHILADAAKVKPGALKVLQNLARGSPPPESAGNTASARETTPRNPREGSSMLKSTSFVTESKGLSDIYEKTEDGSGPSAKSRERMDDFKDQNIQKQHVKPPSTSLPHEKTEAGSTMTDYARLNTGCKAEIGSARESKMSEASSVATYTNALDTSNAGLHGWHWEVAITYTDIMADICLHGNTSDIQKTALIGNNKEVDGLERKSTESPMSSAGLLDLVFFHAKGETHDGSRNDWSWRIRYAAMQGLVKICQCCAGQPTKEGMRNVVWNVLLTAQSQERDTRVLEALKVGQVDANIEKLLSTYLSVPPSSIGAKVALGLSTLYLPPLPPPVESPVSKKFASTKVSPRKVSPRKQSPPRKPLRTSLKEEIALATALYEPPMSFEKRANFDLNRVVEDQWRKDLQRQLEDEEEERQKELEQQQTQAEEQEKQTEESRKSKLKDRYKGNKAYDLKSKSRQDSNSNLRRKPGSKGPSPSMSAVNVT